MEFFIIYLYTVLDELSYLSGWVLTSLIIFSFCTITIGLILSQTSDETEREEAKRVLNLTFNKKFYISFVICTLIYVIVPTHSDMKTIIGGGLAWKGSQLEGVSDLPQNLIDVTNKFLEDMKEKGE